MILHADNITLQFGDTQVLDNASAHLNEGELLGLIGPNGAGKTSLLRVMANLQQPDSGTLSLDGQPAHAWQRRELAQRIGYLAQGAPAHWPLKVRRLVELGRIPHLSPWSRLRGEDLEAIDRAMQQAEVEHLADRVVSTLSGGERLRVLLARLFATDPKIILADEPIAALDPYHQLHTMELLKQHCERGGSAVAVLHDLNMAARFCDRLILVDHGRVVLDDATQAVLSHPQLREVYGIQLEQLEGSTGPVLVPHSRLP